MNMSRPFQHCSASSSRPKVDGSENCAFFFFIFKKIKISKIYVRFEIFQKYPRSPPIGRQALSVFFFSNSQWGHWKKKSLSPPNGRQGPVAPASGDRWAQRAPRPTGAAGGPVAPPSGDRGNPPYIRSNPPFPPHLSPKIPPKIQKKERGDEKGSGEALPDSALVICRLVHLVYIFFYLSTTHLSRSNLSRGE